MFVSDNYKINIYILIGWGISFKLHNSLTAGQIFMFEVSKEFSCNKVINIPEYLERASLSHSKGWKFETVALSVELAQTLLMLKYMFKFGLCDYLSQSNNYHAYCLNRHAKDTSYHCVTLETATHKFTQLFHNQLFNGMVCIFIILLFFW
jgi:hypothetical protein